MKVYTLITLIGYFASTFLLFTYTQVVIGLPDQTRFGYDTQEGGYSSRNWGNLYKHGSPSLKIGGLKPFAKFGSASFYLRSSFGPGYVTGKWKDKYPERRLGFTLKEWDKDRELDGFLCRNTNDCRWADLQLECQRYEINVEFLKGTWKGWFNATRNAVAGECACRSGFYFDDISLSCREVTNEFNLVWIIVAIAILLLILLLSCRFCIFCICKD